MARSLSAGAFFLLLAAALAWSYGGMRRNDAVYDDPILIQENPGIQSLRNLPRLFTRDYARVSRYFKTYRPVSAAAHMLAYAVVAKSPNGHRLLCLGLHFLNACLLFLLCRAFFFPGSAIALWAALIFALHPVASECVLMAASLDAPLAWFFCQASLCAYLRFRAGPPAQEARAAAAARAEGTRRLAWGAASWAAFVLALFSKETAALFPLSLAACEILFGGEGRGGLFHDPRAQGLWSRIARPAPFFLALIPPLIAYAWIRFQLFGEYARAPYIGGTFLANLLTSLKAAVLYARLLLWPHPLSINYRVAAAGSWTEPRVLAGAALLLGLAAALWALRGNRKALFWLFGLLWPMAAVLNFVPFFDEVSLVNDRHLYFSLSAFAVLSAWGLSRLSVSGLFFSRAAAAAGILLLAAGSGLIRLRVQDWRDEVSLHRQAVRVSPDSYRAYNDLGWAYHARGDFAQAEESYQKALAIFPAIVVWVRLCALWEAQGRVEQASRVLEQVMAQSDALSIRHYGMEEQAARLRRKLGELRPGSRKRPAGAP